MICTVEKAGFITIAKENNSVIRVAKEGVKWALFVQDELHFNYLACELDPYEVMTFKTRRAATGYGNDLGFKVCL